MQKYPRGSRGSLAKGVVWEDCSAGSNPAFCAKKEMDVCPSPFWRRRRARTRELSRVRARGGNGDGKLLTRKTRAQTLCCEATESRLLRCEVRASPMGAPLCQPCWQYAAFCSYFFHLKSSQTNGIFNRQRNKFVLK